VDEDFQRALLIGGIFIAASSTMFLMWWFMGP